MGVVSEFMGMLFGSNRNVLVETAQVFRENSENAGVRQAALQDAALQQLAAEFARPTRGAFDRIVDGLNRLPRPMLAFGTLALLGSAMSSPEWFAARMAGLAMVPEPLWWLLGAIVSFYFGARHQVKGQEFQRAIADTLSRFPPPSPVPRIPTEAPPVKVQAPLDTTVLNGNAALADWQAQRGG